MKKSIFMLAGITIGYLLGANREKISSKLAEVKKDLKEKLEDKKEELEEEIEELKTKTQG